MLDRVPFPDVPLPDHNPHFESPPSGDLRRRLTAYADAEERALVTAGWLAAAARDAETEARAAFLGDRPRRAGPQRRVDGLAALLYDTDA